MKEFQKRRSVFVTFDALLRLSKAFWLCLELSWIELYFTFENSII